MKEKTTFKALTLRSIAFLLPLLLILVLLSLLFEPKNNTAAAGMEAETANGILAEPENTIDVLIIGDSESYSSFSPMQMWEEQGITSYVCGSHAQNLMESYEFLKKALRTQSPRAVILETNEIFRRMYPQQIVFNAVANPLKVFRYHDRWKTFRAEDCCGAPVYTNVNDCKGFFIRHRSVAVKDEQQERYMLYEKGERKIRILSRWYLDKITKQCKKRDIPLILVSTPSTKNWNFRKHNCIQNYADKHNLTYLDLNLFSEELGLNWREDSKDGGDHLNLKGAQKVNRFFGPWLKNMTELPDRRTDPRCEAWKEQLERYHRAIDQNGADYFSLP